MDQVQYLIECLDGLWDEGAGSNGIARKKGVMENEMMKL